MNSEHSGYSQPLYSFAGAITGVEKIIQKLPQNFIIL